MTFDPLVEERVAPNVTVPRSDRGEPEIVPRGETEAVPYTRASGLADFLVRDVHHLKQWEERYLAHWLGLSPDLASWAAQVPYSTGPFTGTQPISTRQANAKQLDEIIAMALERGRIHEAANAGSVVHAATEPGAPDVPMHPLLAKSVEEYHKLTVGIERVASEVFVVCDEIRAAGTFDSGYLSPEYPGCIVVGDTKTGKGYHQAEFEVQLATYARGEVYLGPPDANAWAEHSPYADQRLTFEEFFGVPVNLDVGYLVHVPLEGKPKPRIVKLDLQRGWYYAQRAAAIRDDRAAWDKVGIGEKVDTRALAVQALDERLAEVIERHEARIRQSDLMTHLLADADQAFHQDATDLYNRFKHVWQESHTLLVKGRLA